MSGSWRIKAVAALALVAIAAWGHPNVAASGREGRPPIGLVAAEAGRHADPALEALLPTVLGGVTLTVESQRGTELSTNSAAFDAFLTGLGKTREDFSLASAYARGINVQVGAWHVKGADPARLLPGFKQAVQASATIPLAVVEETAGGRPVTRIGDPGQLTGGPLYVVLSGDTLLFVQTSDQVLAEEALRKLRE